VDAVSLDGLTNTFEVGALDGQRLFCRDVQLAIGAGQDHGGALVVGAADSNHVELLFIEHLAVIGVAPDTRGKFGHLRRVGIGNRNQLDVG